MPFNPLERKDPLSLLEEELEDRAIGGLGIFFVKRLMDDIHYEYDGGLNRFRMWKRFGVREQNV
ncbi:hypothetical protein D3C80_2011220 [compost metagenome]